MRGAKCANRKLASVLIVLVVISSCSTGDRGQFLQDSTCTLPCWNGVKPGVTSEDELLRLLADSEVVDAATVTVTNNTWQFYENAVLFDAYPSGWLLRAPWQPRFRVDGEARLIDRTVVELTLCAKRDVELGLVFGDVVAQVGEPTGVISLRNPHVGGIEITAISQDVGVIVRFNTTRVPRKLASQVAPESPIACLLLFSPTIYGAMLDAGIISGVGFDAGQTMDIMYPWAGYGVIEDLYPPRGPSSE